MFAALDKRSDETTAMKQTTTNSKTNFFETMILFPRVSFDFAPCVFLFFATRRDTGSRKAAKKRKNLSRKGFLFRAAPIFYL
jgi:hypothetical protein